MVSPVVTQSHARGLPSEIARCSEYQPLCARAILMNVAGIEIPSNDPVFLAVVLGIHIPLGLTCAVVGLIAMFSKKGRGRHSACGKIYFWCLLALTASATYLSIVRLE